MIKRLLILWCVLIGLIWLSQQPRAWWQSVSQIAVSGGGGGGYTGPGDILSGATYAVGLRCYATAYTGNMAEIWDGATGSTTQTILTCSSGNTINETVNALSVTCAVSCRVKTLYDMSGNTNCSAAACNFAQATNANRPVYTASCANAKPCMTFAATQWLCTGTNINTVAQPLTWIAATSRTGAFTSYSMMVSETAGGNNYFTYRNSANSIAAAAGTSEQNITASDSTLHSLGFSFDGASSTFSVDGTTTTVGATPGGQGTNANGANPICIGSSSAAGASQLTGTFMEHLMYPSHVSSGNMSTFSTNQLAYW